MNSEMEIGIYVHRPAELVPYDTDYPNVATKIAHIIKSKLPLTIVEHIGSTAIPNCDGKGIIDLMILYPKGHLEDTTKALYCLGFQPQPHKDPFPKERPMLVGTIAYNQREFQIHLHIIRQDDPEADSMTAFRDRLWGDIRLMKKYVRCKNQILRRGTTDSLEYCREKQAFIKNVLDEGSK